MLDLGAIKDKRTPTIGVFASIGHAQETLFGMFDGKIFIIKLVAVDGFPASAVEVGEVSALNHKVWDDTMEARAPIAEIGFLADGKLKEVSGRLWDLLAIQTHDNAARLPCTIFDVEEDLLGDGGVSHGWS